MINKNQKFNKEEALKEVEAINTGKPKAEFTSKDVGIEVAKIIKRMPINRNTISFMKYLKKKYE